MSPPPLGRDAARCLGAALLMLTPVAGANPARAEPANPLTDLVDAAAQRLQTAEAVAAVKWSSGIAVEDPARVHQELTTLTAAATAHDLDPGYVRRVFGDQIDATEAIEYRRFAQWKLDPASAPSAPPDLSVSRSAIDALNDVMVSQIGFRWGIMHSAGCTGHLDEAKRDVTGARGLDSLYQQALSFATRSYCQP